MKNLNSEEKFICEIIWGGVPVDVDWVRSSKLFKEEKIKFEHYKFYNDLFTKIKKNDNTNNSGGGKEKFVNKN